MASKKDRRSVSLRISRQRLLAIQLEGGRSIEMSGYGDAETKKLRDNIENQLTRLLQQLQVCLHASRALSAGPKNIHGESGVDDGMKDRIARTAQ